MEASTAVGCRVEVSAGSTGFVRFVGQTSFASGIWVGVELDQPTGKNDGSVQGVRYFDCKGPFFGVFVRANQVKATLSQPDTTALIPDENTEIRSELSQTPHRPTSESPIIQKETRAKTPSQLRAPTPTTGASSASSLSRQALSSSNSTSASVAASSSLSTLSSLPPKPKTAITSFNTPAAASKTTRSPPNTSRVASPAPSSSSSTPDISNKTTSSIRSKYTPSSSSSSISSTSHRRVSSSHSRTPTTTSTSATSSAPANTQTQSFTQSTLRRTSVSTHTLPSSTSSLVSLSLPDDQFLSNQLPPDTDISSPPNEMISQSSVENSIHKVPTVSKVIVSVPTSPTTVAPPFIPPTATAPTTVTSQQHETAHVGIQVENDDRSKLEQLELDHIKSLTELTTLKDTLRTLESSHKALTQTHDKLVLESTSTSIKYTSLETKFISQTQDLKQTRHLLKETETLKEVAEKSLRDMSEEMEMLAMDKEVAEAKTEELEAELAGMKERVEELELDLEVVKEEMDAMALSSSSSSDSHQEVDGLVENSGATAAAVSLTDVEKVQLERQNERLKEALVKLRDVTSLQEVEYKQKITDLEREMIHLKDRAELCEKLQQKLDISYEQINDLKESLDNIHGAEELVEHLTEQNLMLGEKVKDFKTALEDLEALKELNDELEEAHTLTEQELRAEIDAKERSVYELENQISSQYHALTDYEKTISQFRDLVKTLQTELDTMRAAEKDVSADESNSHNTLANPIHQADTILNLQRKLDSISKKSFISSIELELAKLQIEQKQERSDMMQLFLPESFFKSDQDSINCLLLFKHIALKSNFIKSLLDREAASNSDSTHHITQKIQVINLKQKLIHLSSLAHQFATCMTQGSEDQYIHLGQVYPQIGVTDRRLNDIIQVINTSGCSDDSAVDNDGGLKCINADMGVEIQRSIDQLAHLKNTCMQPEHASVSLYWYRSLAEMIEAGMDRLEMEVERLYSTFKVDLSDDDDDTYDKATFTELQTSFFKTWEDVAKSIRSMKTGSRRLYKKISNVFEKGLMIPHSIGLELRGLLAQVENYVEFFNVISSETTQHISTHLSSNTYPDLETLSKISMEHAKKIFGDAIDHLDVSDDENIKIGMKMAMLLKESFDGISRLDGLLSGENEFSKYETNTSPPWLSRSQKCKEGYELNTGMEKQIAELKERVYNLMSDVDKKQQSLHESGLRVEVLEKKLENSKAQIEKISSLETRIKHLMEKEREYTETIENIKVENIKLEQEMTQVKKQSSRRYDKFGVSGSVAGSGVSSPVSGRIFSMGVSQGGSPVKLSMQAQETRLGNEEGLDGMDDESIGAQFEALKSAIKYLRSENMRLKSRGAVQSSMSLFTPHDPLMRKCNHIEATTNITPLDKKISEVTLPPMRSLPDPDVIATPLSDILVEAQKYTKDVYEACTSRVASVIDISESGKVGGTKWSSIMKDPVYQVKHRTEIVERLNRRGEDLRGRVKVLSMKIEGQIGKKVHECSKSPVLLGRVRVPAGGIGQCSFSDPGQSQRIVISDHTEWTRLHGVFAN